MLITIIDCTFTILVIPKVPMPIDAIIVCDGTIFE